MEMIFDIIYVVALVGGFCFLFLIADGLYNLAYRFSPWFRRKIDAFYETLPEWTDE